MTPIPPAPDHSSSTVVDRLKQRTAEAQRLGFQIRNEWLDGLESTWCEIGGKKVLFLDLSQSVSEQLAQVNQAIDWSITQATRHQTIENASRAA